jgi:putative FAD-dependent pyridine nucleotide-disulfide oxidoreductase
MIGALGVGALGAGIAWRALSSTRGTGRTQRFVDLVTAALDARFPERTTDEACVNDASSGQHRVVNVEVGEGFGRPCLVSIDVVLPAQDALTDPVAATLALDEVTRATWNNDEMAPVSVRARILVARTDDNDEESLAAPGAQTDAVIDMTALGFADEIARPDELYDRYGAPECDPAWRP